MSVRRTYLKGMLIMLLGIVPALVGIEGASYMYERDWPAALVKSFRLACVFLMVAFMIYGANKFRCANCNTLVAGRWHNNKCPKCKTKIW